MSHPTEADRQLDVREIEGPPFDVIMDALDDLAPGETLRLVSGFEPEPLYDVLDGRGFTYEARQADGEWRVDIGHA